MHTTVSPKTERASFLNNKLISLPIKSNLNSMSEQIQPNIFCNSGSHIWSCHGNTDSWILTLIQEIQGMSLKKLRIRLITILLINYTPI